MGKETHTDEIIQIEEKTYLLEQMPKKQRKFLLGLSIMDVYILKEIAYYEKKGVVRYQLLKIIEKKIGEKMLSTAKFYRILQKFNDEGLIRIFDEKDVSNSAYKITEKGHSILFQVQKTITFSNISIFSLLQNKLSEVIKQVANITFKEEQQRKKIIEIIEQARETGELPIHAKKTFKQGFLIDWTTKRQDDLAEFIQLVCEHAHIMVPEEKIEEIKSWKNEELGITLYSHGKIRELNDEFDFIIVIAVVLLPTHSQVPFLEEVMRILKPGGVLLITQLEALPTKSDGKHHLIIDSLLNRFPLPLASKCLMEETEFHNLVETLELEELTISNYQGLLAATGLKPYK